MKCSITVIQCKYVPVNVFTPTQFISMLAQSTVYFMKSIFGLSALLQLLCNIGELTHIKF